MKEKILKWLNKQGYPLEMEVASKFLDNDFGVEQSKLYNDPETGTLREIDIVTLKTDWSGFFSILPNS